ncbi:MAG: type IX secretion system sortase PorU [Bacteroidales bacterium]
MRTKSLLIAVILMMPALDAASQNYVSSSVLSRGTWMKIAVTEPGIHRLDYSKIREMGIANPSTAVLYGNNAGQLSFYTDGSAPDDLRKIAVMAVKGSDGVFNEGDYLLFYAEGTHRWKYNRAAAGYEFLRHHYSDTAWYFVTSEAGGPPQVTTENEPAQPYNRTSSSTDVNLRHEREETNLIRSGREWYQQVVPGIQNNISPGFTDLILTEKIRYAIRVLGRSDAGTSFTLRQGAEELKTLTVTPVNMTDINGTYASITATVDSCLPSAASSSFSLTFSAGGNLAASGYIDYADFFARARLVYRDRQLFISDSRTAGSGAVTRFTIDGSSSLAVWDVSDPAAPREIRTTSSAGTTIFTVTTDTLRKFLAFNPAGAMQPAKSAVPVPNQDLHGLAPADMIIVTHPLFAGHARQLADLHQADDGTTSIIVTTEQVYNEFSGGIPDAAAIRNFVKMIYDRSRSSDTPLKYLLLFGDGSYENKTPPPKNSSFVPTWQSVNSHVGVLSFTSDDFYGLLDDGEGEADGYLDIGIGRLPAADTASAGIMVRKISSYLGPSSMGSWRNVLCIVADDEDSNIHMLDAEGLSSAASAAAPPFSTQKIYLDSYRQVTSVTGDSYPDAVRAVDDRVAAGALIMNYVGHGNESGLAHERVIRTDNINSWKNGDMLPLFITATCEFSRFDDVDINLATGAISARTSAGEMVMLNRDGGGIALMSTTRVVYSAPNYTLNRNIFDYAFRTAADGRSMRLGDIIRLAKVSSGPGMNKRNFLLLGDPALRLAWPVHGKVVTDSINGVSVELTTDTLKALSTITISGHIEDNEGSLMTGFNGTVEPTVFDKESHVVTLANDGGSPMSYPVNGNIIFRGTTSVTGGRFRFSFIVTLDINYSFGNGSISYYAQDGTVDINGSFRNFVVGGFSETNINDNEGPQIRLFMNDTLFRDGGITDASPALLALLSDESGINATGTGIGHDIIAWIDDDMSGAVVLNNLFRADLGTHTSGSLAYPLVFSGQGEHTLSLRAWDNLNNPSVATLRFVVGTSGKLVLDNLLAFPNPVTDGTKFTAGHNRPATDMDITITIFDNAGRAVRVLRERVNNPGYTLAGMPWDGCDSNGGRLARGLYLWRIEAVTAGGEKSSATGRIIIL